MTATLLVVAAVLAFCDIVNWVALTMLVMTPPMPLPLETAWPGHRPAVELTVTVGLFATEVELARVTAVIGTGFTPPELLKVMPPLKVLAPTRLRTPAPLRLMTVAAAICPWLVAMTTLALLIVSVPVPTWLMLAEPPSVRVPWSTNVPPL